ncbi:MAG: hypothetical protein WC522_07350 [Candidatus Omnitrophota bacterium]
MPKLKSVRNVIILVMLGIWTLILATPFSEILGIVPDGSRESEQVLDELMSTPFDIAEKTLKEYSCGVQLKSSLQNTCAFSQTHNFNNESISCSAESKPFRENSVFRVMPKLFQLFSVYRF